MWARASRSCCASEAVSEALPVRSILLELLRPRRCRASEDARAYILLGE